MTGREHIVDLIEKNRDRIWNSIATELHTQGISILNNSVEYLNRYTHGGAHIYTYSLHYRLGHSSTFRGESSWREEDKHNPENYEKHYIIVTDNVDVSPDLRYQVGIRDLEERKKFADYVLAIHNNKISLTKISDLEKIGSYFNQKNQEVGLYAGLNFREYEKYPWKTERKMLSAEKRRKYLDPQFLGNWSSNPDQHFWGDYVLSVESPESGNHVEFRGCSWRNISNKIGNQIPAGTLQRMWRNHKYSAVYRRKDGRKLILRIGEGDMTFAELKAQEARFKKVLNENPVVESNGDKLKTVKGTLKTTGWTTLTDRHTPEWKLKFDQFDETQVCVNKSIDKYPCRTNQGVHKQNYLFECDNISLEKQVDLINSLPQHVKDSILWCCYSGSKSIHTVIKTNLPEDTTADERKYIHGILNSLFFNGEADPSGQNASRLARTPNATRENGRVQKAFFINDDRAVALDVSVDLAEYREEKKKLSEKLKKHWKPSNNSFEHTLEGLEKWNQTNPSKPKQECIEYLKGNGSDWNRTLAVVITLSNFGWGVDEILAEAPYGDKWFKSAIKKFRKGL